MTDLELSQLSEDVQDIIGELIFDEDKITEYHDRVKSFKPRNSSEEAKFSHLKYIRVEDMSEFDFWKLYEEIFVNGVAEIEDKRAKLLEAQNEGKVNKFIPIANLGESEIDDLYLETFGDNTSLENIANTENSIQPIDSKYLVWSGVDFEEFDADLEAVTTFKDAEKLAFTQDEFETEEEFNSRVSSSKSSFLNFYLGTQEIVEMTYSKDNEMFDVAVKGRLFTEDFSIKIPKERARDFKEQVSNFMFLFTKDFILEKIQINFDGNSYFGELFNQKILLQVEKERAEAIEQKRNRLKETQKEKSEEISKFIKIELLSGFEIEELYEEMFWWEQDVQVRDDNTVIIGNLMFRDKNGNNGDRATWKTACDFCKNMNKAGFSDWRVPTKREFELLLKYKDKFTSIKDDFYWTSDKYPDKHKEDRAWYFDLDFGDAVRGHTNNKRYVRCIRDIK
jgi:hypothetical protein